MFGRSDRLSCRKRHGTGFDYWASRNLGGDYFDAFYCLDTPEQIPLKGYEIDGRADLAIDFIKRNSKQPFFLMLAWRAPHPSFGAPEKYEKMYDARKLTRRPNVPYEESINVPFILRYPRAIEAGQKTDTLLNSPDVMPTPGASRRVGS